MLNHIYIKNFTIVESLDFDLHKGMTALTGETGAGKSILIDAIELTLGKRAASSMVGHNSERADISLVFDISNLPSAQACLKKYDLDHEGECLIRRTIYKDGRSKSTINGIPTTLQPLRELSDTLINIHGQHEFQTLLKPNQQLRLLDAFAKNETLLKKTKEIYCEWKDKKNQFMQIKENNQNTLVRTDFLNYQIQELDEVNLQENEYDQINQEHRQLAHADVLLNNCQTAITALNNEQNPAIIPLLHNAHKILTDIQNIDPKISTAAELLNNAIIQSEEADHELRNFLGHIDLNPERFNFIEQRLTKIHDIARKHHVQLHELIKLHQDMKDEINQLENRDEHLQNLQTEIETLEKNYFALAAQLAEKRKKSAKKLNCLVTKNMQQLGMPGGTFSIEFNAQKTNDPHLSGMETITFLVSANAGQHLQPLSKVASGGELSRISLAIQVVTAQQNTTPILVFDEVDIGIGGAVAEIVGKLLTQLGQTTQVLCITHLAQVAAKSHNHLRIEKINQNKKTNTKITTLDQKQKIQEIARMLGGIKITDQTLAHAREMVEQ